MPELPEVETVVRDLRPALVGRHFRTLRVGPHALRKQWSKAWEKQILGQQVEAIGRRGKWIVIDLAGPNLLVHLGMTGQLTVVDQDKPLENHTHLVARLDDDRTELRFRDIRRFGSLTLFPDSDQLGAFFDEAKLGPEPFDVEPGYWREAFGKTGRNLKAILLDQTVVAGVGNIYADESLFEAKLHPSRLGSSLTKIELDRLRHAVARVLTRAIEGRGSTIRDYVGGSGLMGQYQNEFKVYGRTDEPCHRCKQAIERIVLAGRSTHFCGKCQQKVASG